MGRIEYDLLLGLAPESAVLVDPGASAMGAHPVTAAKRFRRLTDIGQTAGVEFRGVGCIPLGCLESLPRSYERSVRNKGHFLGQRGVRQ